MAQIVRVALVGLLASAGAAWAGAREDLERELRQLVPASPARVQILFSGLEEPNFELEEALFELDGQALAGPARSVLSAEGTHVVWQGEVTPGHHAVRVRLRYVNTTSIVVSEEGGRRWKLAGDVAFDVQAGLEVRVRVVPAYDGRREPSQRLSVRLPAEPVMIARIEDPPLAVAEARPPASRGPSGGASAAPDRAHMQDAKELRSLRKAAPARVAAVARASSRPPSPPPEPRREATDEPKDEPEAQAARLADVPEAIDAGISADELALAPLVRPQVASEEESFPWPLTSGAAALLLLAGALRVWWRTRRQ